MKVLAFDGSPRRTGNTRRLLDAFLSEVESSGEPHEIVRVDLANKARWNIGPCLGCDLCIHGACVQKDSMQDLYPHLREAEIVVLSAPVYFYGLPAQVKCMIDRCQLFFNLKYNRPAEMKSAGITNKPPLGAKRRGVLLSCGASKGSRLFDGSALTVKYWFDALDVEYEGAVLVPGVDAPGDIANHSEVFENIQELAANLMKPCR